MRREERLSTPHEKGSGPAPDERRAHAPKHHRVEDIEGIRARAEDLAKLLLLVDRESVEGILEVANQNSNS